MHYVFEIAYKALVDSAEPLGILPSKDEFFSSMHEVMLKYTSQELRQQCETILGESSQEYCRMNEKIADVFDESTDNVIELCNYLSAIPQKNLSICCFTTDKNNRKMWEDYSDGYSGFCVEYDLSAVADILTNRGAWDILHLLPVNFSVLY